MSSRPVLTLVIISYYVLANVILTIPTIITTVIYIAFICMNVHVHVNFIVQDC